MVTAWLPRGYRVVTALQHVVLRPNRTFGANKKGKPRRPTWACVPDRQPTHPGHCPLVSVASCNVPNRYHGCMVATQEAQAAAKMTVRIGRSMEGININGLF